MGLGEWLRRFFGQRRQPVEMVPYFDVPTGRVVQIPASELRAGAIQIQIQGLEGLVWILPEQLTPSEIRHPPFSEEIRDLIRDIQQTFAEHRDLSVDEWEEGFRRDMTPEREIAIWCHAAEIYRAFAAADDSHPRRIEIYRIIVACLTCSPQDVWRVIEVNDLTRAEAESVVARYFGEQH